MKPSLLITGGNSGAGKNILDYFAPNSQSVSRANGFDIGSEESRKAIVTMSLGFDIFVNHAHNGHLDGQTRLLYDVFEAWSTAKKSGYIFNTGSIATYQLSSEFKRYSVLKRSLEIANQQACKKIENGLCSFRMTLLKPGMLDSEADRQKPHWPGHGVRGQDMARMIEFCYLSPQNVLFNELVISSVKTET
jgi:hypothetical protein